MRKRILFFPILLTLLLLFSCGGDGASDGEAAESLPEQKVPGLTEPVAQKPLMLTSAGQSADVKMLESLMKKSGMPYEIDVMAQPEALDSIKTLVVAIGGSSKGLGAAGIDAEEELDRISRLLDKAASDAITVIGVHIGGEGRRGELSDKFIQAVASHTHYMVVVAGGNDDGLFSRIAVENGIPLEEVGGIVDSLDALKKAFPEG